MLFVKKMKIKKLLITKKKKKNNSWVCPYFTQHWVVFNPAFFRVCIQIFAKVTSGLKNVIMNWINIIYNLMFQFAEQNLRTGMISKAVSLACMKIV